MTRRSPGMGGHERTREGATNVWLTPPEILDALGPFDLDPCASLVRPWPTATRHLTVEDDGLRTSWGDAFVWLNPPYGPHTWKWLARLADHPAGGIALIFARTETRGFEQEVWKKATALRFLYGRLHFYRPNGTKGATNAGAPSVLVAYGEAAADRLARCGLDGAFVPLSHAKVEGRQGRLFAEAPA